MTTDTVRAAADTGIKGPAAMLPSDYASGAYYATLPVPDQDSPFKAATFLRVFLRTAQRGRVGVESYVDVGCGGGGNLELVARGLADAGHVLKSAKGYDISPHVEEIRKEGLEFVHGDFCTSNERADLVTLFDVIEHIPDPIGFIRDVAARCNLIGFHIPLDRSLANEFLDRFRLKLRYPGHLIFLDPASALNLLTMAGLVVLDYEYTLGFTAPSGRETSLQRVAYPLRRAVSLVSPWLLSRTFGGVSLMIVAATPSGQKWLGSETTP